MRSAVGGLAAALALGAATGWGSGSDAVCLRSDAGEVCAEGGDGRVEFTFAVTATDDQGDPIVGDITVSN